jgi:hypothetical protein
MSLLHIRLEILLEHHEFQIIANSSLGKIEIAQRIPTAKLRRMIIPFDSLFSVPWNLLQ